MTEAQPVNDDPDFVPLPDIVTVPASRWVLRREARRLEEWAALAAQEATEHRAAAARLDENARKMRVAATHHIAAAEAIEAIEAAQ